MSRITNHGKAEREGEIPQRFDSPGKPANNEMVKLHNESYFQILQADDRGSGVRAHVGIRPQKHLLPPLPHWHQRSHQAVRLRLGRQNLQSKWEKSQMTLHGYPRQRTKFLLFDLQLSKQNTSYCMFQNVELFLCLICFSVDEDNAVR